MFNPSAYRSKVRLAAVASGVALALAACSSGSSHDSVLKGTPAPGKAGVWLRVPQGNDPAYDTLSGLTMEAATVGPDGTVYAKGLCGNGARVDKSRVIHDFQLAVLTSKCSVSSGIVAMPDGSVLFAADDALERVDSANHTTVVAGVPSSAGDSRAPGNGNSQPGNADASTFRFTAHMAPVGVRPDGSVILMDDDVVWALKNGSLTRLYVYGGSPSAGPLPSRGAVTAQGTIYLLYGTHQTLQQGDFLKISPDGSVQPVQWDSSAPKGFISTSISSDGEDGAYIDGANATSDLLPHLSSGRLSTVLSSPSNATASCPETMNAGAIPCRLPKYVVPGPGMALLLGGQPYVLAVGVAGT